MKKWLIVLIVLTLAVAVSATTVAFALGGDQVDEAPEVTDPADFREVTWDEAIEILNSGHVVQIAQSHSLDVQLALDDGTNIHTTEPGIDDIFDEVTKCGDPCATILLATE